MGGTSVAIQNVMLDAILTLLGTRMRFEIFSFKRIIHGDGFSKTFAFFMQSIRKRAAEKCLIKEHKKYKEKEDIHRSFGRLLG